MTAHDHALVRPENSTNVRTTTRPQDPTVRQVASALRRVATVSPRLAARLGAWAFFLAPPRRRLSDDERRTLAEGRAFQVQTAAGPVHAWAWGHGAPVLLMHGWGGHGAQLSPLVAPLVAAGFMPVALDAPAHGRSPGRRTNVARMARALAAVAAEVGPPHAVVAHSLGAPAAVLAAASGLPVRRVVLVGPAADPVQWLRAWLRALTSQPQALRAAEAAVDRWLGLRGEALSTVANAARMTAPALLVHDRLDREVPLSDAQAIARAWPGARLLETHGLGHRRILRDPAVVEAIVAFCATDHVPEQATVDALLWDRDGRWPSVA